VHQATVVACVLIHEGRKSPRSAVRSFGTMTHELQALRDWLAAERVTHVGMESTGVYWRPVYAVLEGHFELIVGNARHMRNVPWAQDRREGCRVDCRTGVLRAGPAQLRSVETVA
jgi:transposase